MVIPEKPQSFEDYIDDDGVTTSGPGTTAAQGSGATTSGTGGSIPVGETLTLELEASPLGGARFLLVLPLLPAKTPKKRVSRAKKKEPIQNFV